MNILAGLAVLGCLVLAAPAALARELPFPTTPEAIVRTLSPTPSRGLQAVVEDQPRVGALILFDFDSETIQPQSRPLLNAFGEALATGLVQSRFRVVGHTDGRGSRPYNLALSLRRARAVKAYLVARHGIAPQRLSCQGRGSEEPLEDNATEAGQARNRRVEFVREQK